MVEIESFTGHVLKKKLGFKKAIKEFHNKNKNGGNFGFNLHTQEGRGFRIYGEHDADGLIKILIFRKGGKIIGMNPEYKDIIDSGNKNTITLDYVIEQIKLYMRTNQVKNTTFQNYIKDST